MRKPKLKRIVLIGEIRKTENHNAPLLRSVQELGTIVNNNPSPPLLSNAVKRTKAGHLNVPDLLPPC